MVIGIENFKEWFRGYEDQYAIIGGTACDLLMTESGLDFRATKDIDLVLIIEVITSEFGKQLWQYIKAGGYEYCNKSTGLPQFYRFAHPKKSDFPFMIELFTRKPEAISFSEDAVLTPLPMEDDISSLSAILLDDAYYELLCNGRTKVDGVTVLDVEHLILFKAKAWLDLVNRKEKGQSIDSKNIRKHKNDVFRLSELLGENSKISVNTSVYSDLQEFIAKMENEDVALEQFGIHRTKAQILESFSRVFVLK